MPLDFDATDDVIATRLSQRASLNEDMRAVIDRCEATSPHPDWSRLRSLDYEADLPLLRDWITRPFTREPPTITLAGLWFGLSNPVLRDGTPVADVYVAGCADYDPDDEGRSWVRPDYLPRSRYAYCPALWTIYRIAYHDEKRGLGNDAEYPLCLAFTAFTVRRLLSDADPKLFLRGAALLGVAVGFNSGRPELLGELCPDGFITTWRKKNKAP